MVWFYVPICNLQKNTIHSRPLSWNPQDAAQRLIYCSYAVWLVSFWTKIQLPYVSELEAKLEARDVHRATILWNHLRIQIGDWLSQKLPGLFERFLACPSKSASATMATLASFMS